MNENLLEGEGYALSEHTIPHIQQHNRGVSGSASTGVPAMADIDSALARDYFGHALGILRRSSKRNALHCEQPRSTVEAESKPTRSGPEEDSNKSRSGVEDHSKGSRRVLEQPSKKNFKFYSPLSVFKGVHRIFAMSNSLRRFHVCSLLRRPQPLPWRGLAIGVLVMLLFAMCVPATAQQAEVSGSVVSTTDGTALGGVTVTVKNTAVRTMTDNNGQYRIIATGDAVLVFTSVGFQTAEEAIRGRREVNAFLEPTASTLEEVDINAGYYRVKDRERTGSISRITAEEIDRQPVSNPLLALHGRAPGVVITQQSGVPGNAVQIQIRGQNSLRNDGNAPLYIIDGVPVSSDPIFFNAGGLLVSRGMDPLNTLNPQNIESIEILKDADATAIYGSRGANGVVLVTTKKGNMGSARLDVSLTSGISRVPRKLNLLNTEQYLEMRREAYRNDGVEPTPQAAPDLLVWDTDRYTDWQEVLLGNTAHMNDAQLSLSGGAGGTTYRLNGGWRNETMVFPGKMGHRLASAGLNVNQRAFADRLNLSLAVNFGQSRNNVSANNLTLDALTLPPNAPALHNADGSLNWENSTWLNPLGGLEVTSDMTTENWNVNSTVSYSLIKGLIVKANLGYATSYSNLERRDPLSSRNPATVARYGLTGSSVSGRDRQNNWLLEPQVSYQLDIAEHRFDALLGNTFQHRSQETFRLTSTGYINDALIGNTSAAANLIVSQDDQTDYRYAATFARIGYQWRGRYFVNLTGRRDGSSRFGPNRRQANFGAVGAAWIVSEERFMKRIPTISFLKLRGSFGTTGSDHIGDYGYLDTYDVGTYFGQTSLQPAQLFNPDFSWEVNRKLDAELEVRLWDDRVSFAANWYRNTSSNQLVGYALPAITGFTSVQANLPATVENKGWELMASVEGRNQGDFHWRTSLNLSIPRNRLLEYPDIESSSYANTYAIGWPLNMSRRYEYLGVDENGAYTVRDVNGDGRYNTDDRHIFVNLNRRYFGGLQQFFQFGNFSLNLLLEYVGQKGIGNRGLVGASAPGSRTNQLADVMDRWKAPGDDVAVQQFTAGYNLTAAFNNMVNSDVNVVDASFLRMRNVNLNYAFSEALSLKIGLSSFTVFVSGQNLFTITDYNGWEPERPGTTALPTLRTYTFGIRAGI